MDHEQLLEKLGSTQLNMSPAVRDVMQRVREVGLHKVAAHLHGVPEFNIQVAAQVLGTKLASHHLRFSKVAAGIRALHALDQAGEITLEKTAGPPPIPIEALGGAVKELAPGMRGLKPPPIPAAAMAPKINKLPPELMSQAGQQARQRGLQELSQIEAMLAKRAHALNIAALSA